MGRGFFRLQKPAEPLQMFLLERIERDVPLFWGISFIMHHISKRILIGFWGMPTQKIRSFLVCISLPLFPHAHTHKHRQPASQPACLPARGQNHLERKSRHRQAPSRFPWMYPPPYPPPMHRKQPTIEKKDPFFPAFFDFRNKKLKFSVSFSRKFICSCN